MMGARDLISVSPSLAPMTKGSQATPIAIEQQSVTSGLRCRCIHSDRPTSWAANSAAPGYIGVRYQLHFVRANDNATGIANVHAAAKRSSGSLETSSAIPAEPINKSMIHPNGADLARELK